MLKSNIKRKRSSVILTCDGHNQTNQLLRRSGKRRANADALFCMLAISACMRLEWNTWKCWLLHGKVAAVPNQAPGGPDVRVYSCKLEMLATYTGGSAGMGLALATFHFLSEKKPCHTR